MIYEKYLFAPQFLAQRSKIPWDFWGIGVRGTSFVTHNKPLSIIPEFILSESGGWWPEEPTKWLEGWNWQPHLWTLGEGKGVWMLSLTITGQWLDQSCLHDVTFIKITDSGIWRAFCLPSTSRCQEGSTPERVWKFCTNPMLVLCIFAHLAVPELLP